MGQILQQKTNSHSVYSVSLLHFCVELNAPCTVSHCLIHTHTQVIEMTQDTFSYLCHVASPSLSLTSSTRPAVPKEMLHRAKQNNTKMNKVTRKHGGGKANSGIQHDLV